MSANPSRLPPEPEGEPVHHRRYDVQAYKQGPDRLLIRGMVHDQKPPGTYIPDDPEPLSVHQMVVDLTIVYPAMEIVAAEVVMEVTPHAGCTSIEPVYEKLIGVPIARGFSRVVRDLFGGPRGCTHVGALLQAMAPVAIQSRFAMMDLGTPVALGDDEADAERTKDLRRQALAVNLNTCHIWAEGGEQMTRIENDEPPQPPLWAVERLAELGRPVEDWMSGRG